MLMEEVKKKSLFGLPSEEFWLLNLQREIGFGERNRQPKLLPVRKSLQSNTRLSHLNPF